jgi:hypothetical protein
MRYHWVKRPWHDVVGGIFLAGLAIVVLMLALAA